MKVEVTATDIAMGIRGSCCRCAVALAISRAMELPPLQVDVTLKIILIGSVCTPRREIPTPAVVIAFVDRFDRGLRVEPLTFDLEDAA